MKTKPRLALVLAAYLLVAMVSGCEVTEVTLQSTMDHFYTNADEKATLEADIEKKMHASLNEFLVGKEVLDLFFYSIYIHKVNREDVYLGTVSPKIRFK